MDVFNFKQGRVPLLVSIPHSGLAIPDSIKPKFTALGLSLVDTDWHIPELYDFLSVLGCSVIQANYSRYVVDVNRPPDGSSLYPGMKVTDICTTETFMGEAIYLESHQPSEIEIKQRMHQYWQPYHRQLKEELNRLKDKYGYAVLWDAHSIRSCLPTLFEGQLPDLNLGTSAGQSCALEISDRVYSLMRSSKYKVIRNGRFKGGYITRHYGNPEQNIHALQMEIAQIAYMSEHPNFEFDDAKARTLRPVIKEMLIATLNQAALIAKAH